MCTKAASAACKQAKRRAAAGGRGALAVTLLEQAPLNHRPPPKRMAPAPCLRRAG